MKTFWLALIMGAFGAVAVFTSVAAQFPTWVMFIAWVSYYAFGRSLKSAAISFLQIVAGIVMGIVMQLLAMALTSVIGQIGFPIAVFIMIGSLIYIAKIKLLSNIPAWFMGLIVFFGVHPAIEPKPILAILIPIVAGFVFAYLNDSAVLKVSKHDNNSSVQTH